MFFSNKKVRSIERDDRALWLDERRWRRRLRQALGRAGRRGASAVPAQVVPRTRRLYQPLAVQKVVGPLAGGVLGGHHAGMSQCLTAVVL